MSASKLQADVHVRVSGEVADALDELVIAESHTSRNALIAILLAEGLARRNHRVTQARYRARRKTLRSVG